VYISINLLKVIEFHDRASTEDVNLFEFFTFHDLHNFSTKVWMSSVRNFRVFTKKFTLIAPIFTGGYYLDMNFYRAYMDRHQKDRK